MAPHDLLIHPLPGPGVTALLSHHEPLSLSFRSGLIQAIGLERHVPRIELGMPSEVLVLEERESRLRDTDMYQDMGEPERKTSIS